MKTSLLTGVSSGIGQQLAGILLKDGHKVYGVSRRDPNVTNPNFVWLQLDLTDHAAIAAIADKIEEPTIDLFISNAGVAFEEDASDATAESYARMFDTNVLAPILLVHALKPKIQASTIISVSSVADRLVAGDFALYCSSKAAITRYFEALADEFSEATVLSVLPDYVDTPMLRELQAGRDFDWDITIRPHDLAQFIADLGSKKVSVNTGTNIIVVTNGLVGDTKNIESLFAFNTDTQELIKLN